MDADEGKLVWGPRDYPGVVVGLPILIFGESLTGLRLYAEFGSWRVYRMANDPPGIDATCVARLTSTGGPDVASWYDAWAELNAIFSMCFCRWGVLGSSSFGKTSGVDLRRTLTEYTKADSPVLG